MSEYEFLRTEILDDYNSIRNYENLMYTVVAAILVFALGSERFILCLIPYIVILPVFHIVMSTKNGICKIATYMMVFLEGDNFHWETRHYYFDRLHPCNSQTRHKWNTHSQYYLLSFACSISSVSMLVIDSAYDTIFKWIASITIALVTVFIWVVIYQNTFDYEISKQKLKEDWEIIQSRELKTSENKKGD